MQRQFNWRAHRDLKSLTDVNKEIEPIVLINEQLKSMFYYCLASSENLDHSAAINLDDEESNQLERSCIQHRANTTMNVCWHRNLSVSIDDHRNAIKNQLSGYLLRKFKNSNGWQKLWVVFTNFCLFFYKTYQVKNERNLCVDQTTEFFDF